MTEIYRTTVVGAGDDAPAFLPEGMFVTFGENAPAALRDFCFLIDVTASTDTIAAGQRLVIDGRPLPITAVGEVAQQNLDSLGHVTVNLDGASVPKMHGAIHVDAGGDIPTVQVGSRIVIEKP